MAVVPTLSQENIKAFEAELDHVQNAIDMINDHTQTAEDVDDFIDTKEPFFEISGRAVLKEIVASLPAPLQAIAQTQLSSISNSKEEVELPIMGKVDIASDIAEAEKPDDEPKMSSTPVSVSGIVKKTLGSLMETMAVAFLADSEAAIREYYDVMNKVVEELDVQVQLMTRVQSCAAVLKNSGETTLPKEALSARVDGLIASINEKTAQTTREFRDGYRKLVAEVMHLQPRAKL